MNNKILIIQKKTDSTFQASIEGNKDGQLFRSNHQLTKEAITKLLIENSLEFDIAKDSEIADYDFEDYGIIVSLGGDGTFLKCASRVTNQIIIGINSDTESSVGKLLSFDINSLNYLIESITNSRIKTEKWNRLKASINGKELNSVATNEIYIGKKYIFQTSKLDIKINNTLSNTIGNGILFSTQKGSTGFYSSAGGRKIVDSNFGFAFVLPYKLTNDVESTDNLDSDSVIEITPVREDHILIFDCDQKSLIKLSPNDKIKVFVDKKNPLIVAV
jgi:NAD kinase